jgi:hypothetical protein
MVRTAKKKASVTALVGSGLCVAAAMLVASLGWADLDSRDAATAQQGWQARFAESGELPDTKVWSRAQASLAQALTLDGWNPGLHEQMGLLALQQSQSEGVFRTDPSIARDQFRLAVQARPSSGYSWANLATSKYRLGEIDREFFEALSNAALMGPWEPEVQWVVTDLGFAVWDELKEPVRHQVLQMAVQGMRRNADRILTIAEKRGRLSLICAVDNIARFPRCANIRES